MNRYSRKDNRFWLGIPMTWFSRNDDGYWCDYCGELLLLCHHQYDDDEDQEQIEITSCPKCGAPEFMDVSDDR